MSMKRPLRRLFLSIPVIALTFTPAAALAPSENDSDNPVVSGDPAATAELTEWVRIRRLPEKPVDDALGFLVAEAGALARLAADIQALQAAAPQGALDPRLHLALLRSQYFAASIDGVEPVQLLQSSIAARDAEHAPRVRAEAAYRLLVRDLAALAAQRDWDPPLSTEETDRINDYLACHGANPRAIAAVKRLAEHALLDAEGDDLLACRDLMESSIAGHPAARACVGAANAVQSRGTVWSPHLRTTNGGTIQWEPFRGKPAVVVCASPEQRPSRLLLDALCRDRDSHVESSFSLIVMWIENTLPTSAANPPRTDSPDLRVESDAAVRLTRGWREPILLEYGIRALPAVFILDSEGALDRVIPLTDWDMAESVRSALSELSDVSAPIAP